MRDLLVNCIIRREAGVEETWVHILLHCTAIDHDQRDDIRRRKGLVQAKG
jgi:hypothetical protein